MDPWLILGIEQTDDPDIIRKAYNKLVRIHHPEEDPEGFMSVRAAYEQILKELEQAKDTEISVDAGIYPDYLQVVVDLYQDFFRRIQISQWEQLFVSMSLECYDTLIENAPFFFNKHYHLPSDIWRYLDEKLALFSDSRFLCFDAYLTQIGFSFDIFTPDISWNYVQYVELRYQGSVCYSQRNYNQALSYFQRAYDIYDGELALRVKMGQIHDRYNRDNDVKLLLGTITRNEIGNIPDAHIFQVLFQVMDNALTDDLGLFSGQVYKNEIDLSNILFLYIYDIIVLYKDYLCRMEIRNWKNEIIHMPEKVKNDLCLFAPYLFNICYCLPFSVWEFVKNEFFLEHNAAFKKEWIFHSNIKLNYVIYHPDILSKCEDYILNWYDGMEAYWLKDYENTVLYLDMAYEIYTGDKNVLESLTEAHLALGNISRAKHCYDAHLQMEWHIEDTFYPPEEVDVEFKKRNSITVIETLFEQKCREALSKKQFKRLFWYNLGYLIFGVRYLPVKAFFLRGLFLQKKYKLLKVFSWINKPEWNDNFELARFYAQMDLSGGSEYFVENFKKTSGDRVRLLAAFLIVLICAVIGIMFLT